MILKTLEKKHGELTITKEVKIIFKRIRMVFMRKN